MLQATFVDPQMTDLTGILAYGGDLSVASLLHAYQMGAFPWYNEGEPIYWYHPDPRFVLFPNELKVSKSMKQFMRNTKLNFTINNDFEGVIRSCGSTHRKHQGNNQSWIHNDVEQAFIEFHKAGYAISAEAWNNNELTGGLYGVKLGNIFFGESMFANESNASKFAFIKLIEVLKKQGLLLIDCQTHTSHLESLGGTFISRGAFMEILNNGQ